MRKSFALTAAAALLALGLTGCDQEQYEKPPEPETVEIGYYDTAYEFEFKMKDGRTVACIYVDGDRSGGPSCDWGRAE